MRNLDPRFPIFSNFAVKSGSGLTYTVEIRSVSQRRFSCNCVDFRINALGTCKHVEATLLYLEARHRQLFRQAGRNGAARMDVVPDLMADALRIEVHDGKLPAALKPAVGENGFLRIADPEEALSILQRADIPSLRISQDVWPWLEARRRAQERRLAFREYEQKVQSGEWPAHETLVPLFPYQREGMLHLAFTERALLADEMGLGKTIQAIAACALLHRLGKARRVLVVTPASLKTEWEEQIQRFTDLPYQLVFGHRGKRLQLYASAPFFTIVNYEQMLADALDVNAQLQPDVVVLDEAQRIKNWSTKTAQAVKRLQSRYAFVLTGTPIENRIDEHPLADVDFLDPSRARAAVPLQPRVLRAGRARAARGLSQPRQAARAHQAVHAAPPQGRRGNRAARPHRPEPLRPAQPAAGGQLRGHEAQVARLVMIAQKRPLTQQESGKAAARTGHDAHDLRHQLTSSIRKTAPVPSWRNWRKSWRSAATTRMSRCSSFPNGSACSKLVRELCERMKIGFAWHTGSVPQRRRRAEIQLFKNSPDCRVFLSTDSGSTGLNLQNASVVINCDLPWNPARLEQRIARAWRKHQTRAVTVINLVSENTIEHRMLETLAIKQALADGILDLRGDLGAIRFRGGRQAFLARLEQLISTAPKPAPPVPKKKALPADRPLGFSKIVARTPGRRLRPLRGAVSARRTALGDRDRGGPGCAAASGKTG